MCVVALPLGRWVGNECVHYSEVPYKRFGVTESLLFSLTRSSPCMTSCQPLMWRLWFVTWLVYSRMTAPSLETDGASDNVSCVCVHVKVKSLTTFLSSNINRGG